ncbi:MAG TPA: class I SAM-dependent rRNA methyltransferase [candidate division Zixibacteria bacterium]|nr:class I SAM-dependent rRNA methyltransferase [candidate division Zixibacteria bacterium]
MAKIFLKKNEERRSKKGHLWIFSNEIEKTEGVVEGGLTEIFDSAGRFLAVGYYNPNTLIAARILSFEPDPIGPNFFRRRIEAALNFPPRQISRKEACRLIYGESDFLPGLVADRYGDYLAVQVMTLGMEKLKNDWVPVLLEKISPKGALWICDSPMRQMESLTSTREVFLGEVPDTVEIDEGKLVFCIDLKNGQKTGFFLDQKENRKKLAPWVNGKRVLDLFSYTGAWGLAALHYGATEVVAVDESQLALDLALENALLNRMETKIRFEKAEVFEYLTNPPPDGRKFDVVILDPPALIKSKKHFEQGKRGYFTLNRRALDWLTPGGILVTCSCSFHMAKETLWELVNVAALKAGRRLRLVDYGTQAPDHPVLVSMPETEYLKCFVFHVL